MRVILVLGHDFALSLYSFFEFLADVAGRLLRHGARFEKEDYERKTDCAKTSHRPKTTEMEMLCNPDIRTLSWRCQP